ncbi:unnamed protein product [Phytomonas sp. Hart1]|nr:unnamed protein product [Phytomonas sp. Hart1]|eukprot:CCW66218.1 unnamed protein product [Phytomonas sp. isolate Hart1]
MLAAGELIVSDKVVPVASLPQAMASYCDVMWILCDDARCEIRNVRTAEVVKRLERNDTTKAAEQSPLSNDRSHPLLLHVTKSQVSENNYPGLVTGNDETKRFPLQISAILVLQTCVGGPQVWLGLSDGTIEVHHAKTMELCATLRQHLDGILSFAEFGGFVYSSGNDQRVVQWRAAKLCYERTFTTAPGQRGAVWCMCAEGNVLVTGSEDRAVRVWDVGSGRLQLTGYVHAKSGSVTALCRVRDAMWSGDAAGQVVYWQLHTCEAFDVFKPHQTSVTALQRVGGRTYSGAADGTVAIFCNETATLLMRLNMHSRKRVTGIASPAQLSRYVIWSADSRGFVRCWYQDEYIHMTRDYEYFSEATWYLSGSTPYHEFRDSIAAHIEELQNHPYNKEHDRMQIHPSAMRIEGPELQKQYRKLQELIPIMEERVVKETESLQKRKAEMGQLEKDLMNQINLLGSAHHELNALMPGAADRLKATLPPLPSIVMQTNADGQISLSLPSVSLPVSKPCASPTAAHSTSFATTSVPLGTVALPTNLVTTSSVPLASALPSTSFAAPSMPLTTTAVSLTSLATPSVPLATAVPQTSLATSSVPLATAVPQSSLATSSVPLTAAPPSTSFTAPSVPLATAVPSAYGVGGSLQPPSIPPPPPARSDATHASILTPAAPAIAGSSGAGSAVPPTQSGIPVGTDAIKEKESANALLSIPLDLGSKIWNGVSWVNPNVGNYIQRRYYGAEPSLRTPDIMKRIQPKRLPEIKVLPLQRSKSTEPKSVKGNKETLKAR